MTDLTFNELPVAVQLLIDKVQLLNEKFDNLPIATAPMENDDRFVDINEIRVLVFQQWKKQTIYNKCCLGELPHSRIGGRLLFHLKECRDWRDKQIQHGRIKALSQIEDEAHAFFNNHK